MSERQFIIVKNLFIKLNLQHPQAINNYSYKLNLLNNLKATNGKIEWKEVKNILGKDNSITIFNALQKSEKHNYLQ